MGQKIKDQKEKQRRVKESKERYEKKNKTIHVRYSLDNGDYKKIEERANKLGESPAVYIRSKSLGRVGELVKKPVTDKQMVAQINKIGVNINQISRNINTILKAGNITKVDSKVFEKISSDIDIYKNTLLKISLDINK